MADFNYQSESDLLADGFVLTPNGSGAVKVYEKIVHHEDADAERVYKQVNEDGSVQEYQAPSGTANVSAQPASQPKADETPTDNGQAPDPAPEAAQP